MARRVQCKSGMPYRHGKMLPNFTDEELLGRVLAGETALYGILIGRYHTRLFCLALRILRNEADAEDALQEAYIMAMTRLRQFAGRSSFFTWIARITMNEALTRIRGRRRRQRIEEAVASPGDFHRVYAPVATPEQLASRRELDGVLRNSMRALPEGYRRVFEMREIEEVSTADAARSLGLSEECVKTRLHRARALLRRRIDKHLHPCRNAECLAA
jgi:RNA polymerase sigma-70 factor (ECF subfamily)